MTPDSYRKYLSPLRAAIAGVLMATTGIASAAVKKEAAPQPLRVIPFNADKFDLETARGAGLEEAARKILAEEGYPGAPAKVVRAVASRFTGKGYSPLGVPGPAVAPASVSVPQDGICVLVSARPIDMLPESSFVIHGMEPQDIRTFLNARQERLCQPETRLSPLRASEDLPAAVAANYLDYKRACLADAETLGEMIRADNRPPAILESIAEWRAAAATASLFTYSTPVLQALRAGIDKMGLDAFRKLSNEKAGAYYLATTEKNAVSPEALGHFITYAQAVQLGQWRGVRAMETVAAHNESVRRGLDILTENGIARDTKRPLPEDDTSLNIRGRIEAWDALGMLEDLAFETRKAVTPVTMSKAYAGMQAELARRQEAEPLNPLWTEQAVKLRAAFVVNMPKLDFAAETAKRAAGISRPMQKP